jgi:heptaprenyl diphosphate synthase
MELEKEPGQDLREGVYTLPVLHALRVSGERDELTRILALGPPDGEMLDRALDIVHASGGIAHARAAVTREVGHAVDLAERLPEGPAQHALVQLARFLAARCGAEQVADRRAEREGTGHC